MPPTIALSMSWPSWPHTGEPAGRSGARATGHETALLLRTATFVDDPESFVRFMPVGTFTAAAVESLLKVWDTADQPF